MEQDLLDVERRTVKKVSLSGAEVRKLKKDKTKILAKIIEGVNRRNGAQHPLDPPKV